LENRNLGEMKRVYELDVYKPAEALTDMVWNDFDKTFRERLPKFILEK